MGKTAQASISKIRKHVHANPREFVTASEGQNIFCKLCKVLVSCVKQFIVESRKMGKTSRGN